MPIIPFLSPVELYAAMANGAPESVQWIGLGPISQADKDYALEIEPLAKAYLEKGKTSHKGSQEAVE